MSHGGNRVFQSCLTPKIGIMEKLILDGQSLRLEEIEAVALAGLRGCGCAGGAKTCGREPRV